MTDKIVKPISRRKFVKTTTAAAVGTGAAITGFPALGAGKRKLRYIAFINRNSAICKSTGPRYPSSRSSWC